MLLFKFISYNCIINRILKIKSKTMRKLIFLKTEKKICKIFIIKFKKLLFIIAIVVLNILVETKLIKSSNYYKCLTAKIANFMY